MLPIVKTNRPVCQFADEYAFLSNFYPAKMEYRLVDGVMTYPKTLEHCFQAAKSLSYRDQLAIIACRTPGEAKRLGRTITLRWDWEMVKDVTMLNLLRVKFSLHQDMGECLKATGDAILVEGNNWGDQYWGATWDGKHWVGHNKLGKLLMQVRSELRGD